MALKVTSAAQAFPACPACCMGAWLKIWGRHVFCGFCNWNSIAAWRRYGGSEEQVEGVREEHQNSGGVYEVAAMIKGRPPTLVNDEPDILAFVTRMSLPVTRPLASD